MKHLSIFTLFLFYFTTSSIAQQSKLQSGPMTGYSGFREVLIWVQTKEEADVKIGYQKANEKEQFTATFSTTLADDFIAKLYPTNLEYGTTYTYHLYIDGKKVLRNYPLQFETQPLWQYRTDPPDFNFAIGSCLYINEAKDDRSGKPYGQSYEILQSIADKDPNFMVWMGDNVYLRTPDFLTERGLRHRHRTVRATPELQPLLGGMHHYATWDDHDYGPNDADRSYALKKTAEKAFNDYWGNLNTNASGAGGVTQHFVWNDIEFFMLDDRYHRAPNKQLSSGKDYLGKEQLDWLIDALTASRATFKIVVNGGQVVSDAAVYENYATYPEERQQLLDRLHEEHIEGVLFMSGDRHHTEISKMERPDAYPLVDITCSPLTAGTHKGRDEGNTLQIKNKTYFNQNFGIVSVSGPLKDRVLLLTIYDSKGIKVFDYSIKSQALKYPR